jgi:hypothetical protein
LAFARSEATKQSSFSLWLWIASLALNDCQNPKPQLRRFQLNCQPHAVQQVRRQQMMAENDERRSGF